ncbi:MAG: GNAT family N-acetyltransferase [Bacteroidetes bacterium]|nr:GNAT family N-acetyltransferase [Bacteroidota bacterium]
MRKVIETNRLILRELEPTDVDEMAKVLCDNFSMKYYPKPFTRQKVIDWIEWNLNNYQKCNHGLWAVLLKPEMTFIGDCGITLQEIDGENLPELGYHIQKQHCNKGYASEAAKACIDYAFSVLHMETLYTYTKHDNIPSIRVAQKNGMKYCKDFTKVVMGNTVKEVLYCICKEDNKL